MIKSYGFQPTLCNVDIRRVTAGPSPFWIPTTKSHYNHTHTHTCKNSTNFMATLLPFKSLSPSYMTPKLPSPMHRKT